jgi:hypothetical protein
VKIALCTPIHGSPKAGFAFSYGKLIGHSVEQGLTIRPFWAEGSALPELRNDLAAHALAWDADWVLWADADHTFPADALLRLLAHKRDIIGCNYVRRQWPTSQTASVRTTPKKARDGLVEEAEYLGLGFCLVSARVFREIAAPAFAFERGEAGFAGEDIYFFRKARAEGFKIFVDHGLSWEIGHIHERPLTLADTELPTVRIAAE